MNNSKSKLRVLVLCHDVVGKGMAGPGIRYWHIYKILNKRFSTQLGVFTKKSTSEKDVIVVTEVDYERFFDKADVIFAQWLSNNMIDYARKNGKVIIFDLYAPVPVEYLASHGFSSKKITPHIENEFSVILDMYKNFLRIGQLFTCSNPRQRDFWSGFAIAKGLITPSTFKESNWKDRFVICPMGIESILPKPRKLLLRSTIPSLKKTDFVLLWTGGIWDWFDAKLIIKAMSQVKNASVKLVFLGTKHPNSIYKDEMSESIAARKLATELGLINKKVFFLDGWIPFNDRAAYFMDADAAIYADKESLENRFSHRSRVLDHIWTGLPTICSEGDFLSELIDKKNLGISVKERTPEAFARAIDKLSTDKNLQRLIRKNIAASRPEFEWNETMKPLVQYLSSVDLDNLSRQIKKSYKHDQAFVHKLTIKSRVKKSAKMLLLGR